MVLIHYHSTERVRLHLFSSVQKNALAIALTLSAVEVSRRSRTLLTVA